MKGFNLILNIVLLILFVICKPSESMAAFVTEYFSGIGEYKLDLQGGGYWPPLHSDQQVIILGQVNYFRPNQPYSIPVGQNVANVSIKVFDLSKNEVGGYFGNSSVQYNSINYIDANNYNIGYSTTGYSFYGDINWYSTGGQSRALNKAENSGNFSFSDNYSNYNNNTNCSLVLNSDKLTFSSLPVDINLITTPIPSAFLLLGSGLVGIVGMRKRILS
jgi:hypothetical protein